MKRVLAILLILLALFASNACGQEVIFDVDFADEPLGVWTEIPGVREFWYNAPEIVESPGRPGRSVLLTGVPEGNGDDFYYILPEPVKDTLTVETWLYPTSGMRSIGLAVSNHNLYGNDDAVSLYLHNNGMIRYYCDGWHDVAPYIPNFWVRIKVVLDIPNKTYDIYVNDMDHKVATAPFRNAHRDHISRVGLFMYGVGTQPEPAYVDRLVISGNNP